jgi:hypothetical protein
MRAVFREAVVKEEFLGDERGDDGFPQANHVGQEKAVVFFEQAEAAADGVHLVGNPPANNIKFFATDDVLELVKDRAWLRKVTNTINQHWHRQNSRKKSGSVNGSQNGGSSLLDVMG